MKKRSEYYGRGDIALSMLTDLYERMLYRPIVVECLASRQGQWDYDSQSFKKNIICIQATGV
jgi:hypothetical protein